MIDPTSQEWIGQASEIVLRSASSAALNDLQNDPAGNSLSQLMHNAQRLADSVIREVVEHSPESIRPVCCEGCTACCYLHVVASPLEVLECARFLKSHQSDEVISRIADRIEHHISMTEGLDAAERRNLRIVCPLLEEGKCLAYSARPISCRGWNSLDRSICDADLQNPSAMLNAPVNLAQHILANRVTEGLNTACEQCGTESQPLDFVRGLRIAMEDTESISSRWRQGEPVFHSAVNENVFPEASSKLFDV
jgi:hypothetical protein